MTDHVHLRNISLPLPICVGEDAWHRVKPQPAIISVRISYPSELVTRSAEADDVSLSLNYGTLYRKIEAAVQEQSQQYKDGVNLDMTSIAIGRAGLDLLRDTLRELGIGQGSTKETFLEGYEDNIEVLIHLPKALLRVDGGLKYRTVMRRKGTSEVEISRVEARVEDLKCPCIVGVNPHERVEKQMVVAKLAFDMDPRIGWEYTMRPFQVLTKAVSEGIEASSFQTVEALARHIGKIAVRGMGAVNLTVTVEKPSALAFAEYSGVEMTRPWGFFAALP